MVTIYYKNIKENALHTLEEFKVGSWITVQNPTEDDITYLVKTFSLDEGLVRDATDFYEVPRVEVDASVTYIFARYPYSEDNRILTAPVLIAIGEDFFITVSAHAFPIRTGSSPGRSIFLPRRKRNSSSSFFSRSTPHTRRSSITSVAGSVP